MRRKTVLIVPATVPDARVTRVAPAPPEATVISRVEPTTVPLAQPVPVLPEQLTVEQVALLRAENDALREELDRVRSR